MSSVEKRRSGRKSGGHRKHSDGGYSDTSSGGSFLDETDREVSTLTDRAFRSLCIGDEAVYNDSDLCSSSPCSQRDRQLAFSRSQDRDREDREREREELKRSAHESFSLRVQQYEQDWIHGGTYGAEIHRDPQWEVYGERTQGRVSATFQHSFAETSQQEQSLRENQLSFLCNGATELRSQQRRSRSRVSSLIRAFNSDRHGDAAEMDGQHRECSNNKTSWDRSALMSIQRELSEFSTSYQQNFNSDHFQTAGPFSSWDANFYSSEEAALGRINSYTSASHGKHSMSTQVNCNPNVFIHSEFSPFKVWRDHNRFPFQQGEVSGFMHSSEFPKWYQTPMYKELSQEAQPRVPYRFEGHQRNNLLPVVPHTPPRSTSTSTMLQRAAAIEKRSESDLAGHYPHRKRAQSLGNNRLPSQRPSTASPTTEISPHVRDTISSVRALQQKIKMMTEQSMATGTAVNQQGALWSKDEFTSFGNNTETMAPHVARSNTTPHDVSQVLTHSVPANQETSLGRQYAASPQPVEHPPVRAESRGATPDVRMSSYKSRATSLLFNLKDNRKRVKNTYSPTKFKNTETPEKHKQPSIPEPSDTVIDIPDLPDPGIQFTQVNELGRTNVASYPYVNQYQSPGNSHPKTAHATQFSEYAVSGYQSAQPPGEMVHHSRFTGFMPENYTVTQMTNGQNPHEDLLPYTPYKQYMTHNIETTHHTQGDVYGLQQSYRATEKTQQNTVNNQSREYFQANAEQHFNETVGREYTKVDRYQQFKDSKQYNDYSNVSSQDRWRQTNSQDTEMLSRKAAISPWKQEITALIEKDQHAHRAGRIEEQIHSPRDKNRRDNQQSINKEPDINEFRQRFDVGISTHKNMGLVDFNFSERLPHYSPATSKDAVESQAYYGQQQPVVSRDKYVLQKQYGHNEDNYLAQNYRHINDEHYSNKHQTMCMQETGQRKVSVPKGHESLQSVQATPQFENNMQKNLLCNPVKVAAPTITNQVKDMQLTEVKAEKATVEHLKAQHAQAELAGAQHWAQVEQPKAESAGLIIAGQTGSEKVNAEQAKAIKTECEGAAEAKAEHIKEEERKGDRDKSREKHPGRERAGETQVEKTRRQEVTEEARGIPEEAGVVVMKDEQGERVNAEPERLKEEHVKTKVAKAEQARTQGIATRRETIKVEKDQVRAEQISRQRVETEQTKTEKMREHSETDDRKRDQVKPEQVKEQHVKTEHERMKLVEVGKVKVDQIKVMDVRREKPKDDSVKALNAEQPATQSNKAKEQTKLDLAKAERMKTDLTNLQERLAKPGAKPAVTQQVKGETDKVEQVKTELAKAKAELAKIKEKMRGEQKEKAKNTIVPMEDVNIRKDVSLAVNIIQSEQYTHEPGSQIQQKKEDTLFSKYGRPPTDRGADHHDSLRERCVLTNAVSTNRKEVSVARNDSMNENNQIQTLSPDTPEIVNDKKSTDRHTRSPNTEHKEEDSSVKSHTVTDCNYVYSELSKEFKLFASDHLPGNAENKRTSDTVTDKLKNGSVENKEKCEAVKHTDDSQQRDSDLTKLSPLERKPKSAEHSPGPAKDLHLTPPRLLSHKERAQTKQEILTSKIKAHAEKEISAIKEKGFAIRDGFISKNPSKQLASVQSMNIRQRPASKEVSKKHESTVSTNITPKHQLDTVKSMVSHSSATAPVKPAATTGQSVDYPQQALPKEPERCTDDVATTLRDVTQMGYYNMIADKSLVEHQKKEKQAGVKSPMQSKEQTLQDDQGKQQSNDRAISGKQKDGLKEDVSHATEAPIKAASAKHTTTKKAESKHTAVPEDSAPLLNFACLDQNKNPVADDSLQILGIKVTTEDRKPPEKSGQRDNNSQEKSNVQGKEYSDSVLDKCLPSSSKGNELSKEGSTAKAKDRNEPEMFPKEMKDETKISVNNHPENVQENITLKTRKNNVSEELCEKMTDLPESSSIDTRPQRETQLHEPLSGEGVQSPATEPAKNNALAETQPHVYVQDIETNDHSKKMENESSARSIKKDEVKDIEEKNPEITQTAHTSENVPQMGNTGLNSDNDPNRADAEALVGDAQSDTGHHGDVQLSSTKDVTSATNPLKSREVDVISAPLLEEKKHDPTQLKPFNSPLSPPLPENQNRCVSPKQQYKETQTGDHIQVGGDVHIDSIAIRVVPAASKGNLNTAGNRHVIIVSPDVVIATDQTKVASSSCEEKVESSSSKVSIQGLSPTSSEKQMKDSLEDKLQVQHVLSSVRTLSDSLKISNQQNSINVNTQVESGNPEKVQECEKSLDKSNIRALEGDYFQVQGATETNNEIHNGANVGESFNSVSQGRELPGLLQNKAPVSNKPHMEVKNNVFALDQSTKTIVDSSSVSVQNENMENKDLENEGKLSSKRSDGLGERQSNMEKTEPGQTNHIRKHPTGSQSNLSARERQSSRHSQPMTETTVNEKPEVKPKPKDRVSTIPEISAIADYARLKVIVSEEQENTIQEFPPNKKEGFFPLIQTRHSRRPVFTVDPKDVPVKEKHLPHKTEGTAKVNKEPKAIVFPITEKEHQRTGMFKLGDKERQESVREKNTSLTTQLKSQGKKEQTSKTDLQKVQVDQTIPQPDNPPLQTLTSSSVVNKPRNAASGVRSLSNSHENISSQAEKIPIFSKDSSTKPAIGQIESTTTLRNNDKFEKTEEERKGKPRQKGLKPQPEEPTSKQNEETSWIEETKRAEEMRIKHILEKSKASLAEEERRAAQREEERRIKEREAIAIKIKERREKQREADKRAEEERKAKQIKANKADQKEEEIRAKQGEDKRRAKELERIVTEEERREKQRGEEAQIRDKEERMRLKQQEERASQKEQQRGATQEEQQRRAAEDEQQRRAAEEEQQRRAAQEKQQRRAAEEEQLRRAAEEERQRRAAEKEQLRRAAEEEQQRRAAEEEQQRRAAEEEQQRRAAQEKQQRRAAQEEQLRMAAEEEQQRRAALEEQQRRAAEEEQQRRAALEEQQRRAAEEEQQRRAAQEEQLRRAAQEEQQRREEEQRRAALEEQQRRAALEEQQRREEEQRRAALEEQQRRALQKEQQRRAAEVEQQRKAELEEQQRRVALIEKPRQTEQTEETTVTETVEGKKRRQRGEEDRNADEKGKTLAKQREEAQIKEESQAEEESRAARERPIQREDEIEAKRRGEEERFAAPREEERVVQAEEQRRAAQMVDALQYYAITSTESQRKPKDRQLRSPLPPQQKNNSSVHESSEDTGTHNRLNRPHCPSSPAPSLPRSNTSSPALGAKPLMFRVKDNTTRGSSFTKSVKPRFHKNFGEDLQVGSPMERLSERAEEERDSTRHVPVHPIHPEAGINKLAVINEFSSSKPTSSSQDHSAHLPQHRPYSRRSMALDEDDSRSVISNMSEDVESLALSAADLADVRGLYDYERPESACSYSSDVSRTMGKPPVVPPKSEKALLRAKRLTSRRMKKELSKSAETSRAGVGKPQQDVSSHPPPSSSTETHSSNRCAVASPHFSSPISLAHAPTLGSTSLPSHKEHSSSHHSVHASPHGTGPISLPTASPHATVSASQPAALKTVAHVSSSPTFNPANRPAPVTQYHVESSYPPSYPLTQRKVLQDLGSGQYFVVDVPVQVKTKTFFDPETGKYVQLNVRESGQSNAQPKLQQTYPHTQLHSQVQVKMQQQPHSQASTADKPFVLYQGHHGYSQGYQPAAINSTAPHRSSAPVTVHQNQQPVRENQSCGYPASDMRQNSEGHCYSPEKTPYMDTVNDSEKTYNRVYSTHGSYDAFPECDTNSQLAGSSACENDNSAHSRCQPRDIITMSELEDFMEVSDW